MRKYFGTDGVRGKANTFPMTADFALKLGQAVAVKFMENSAPPHQIVIGKDTRLSCYMFEAALVSGICSKGVNAVLVGAIPTPAISFITKSLRANAGIVISASHNPYYDNGIKIFDAEGQKLSDDVEAQIEKIIDCCDIPLAEKVGKALRIETAVGRYVEYAKSSFDKNLDLKGLKIVVDCANGASYKVAPLTIAELGANTVVIFDKPDGTNINENCGATAPDNMVKKVLEEKADLGISFDGDGDRVIVCDSIGNIYDGDFIMGICARYMKKNDMLADNTFVATVMSNQGFVNSMNNEGINVVRSNVGDRYVIEEMKKGGYNLGGEQSGHIIFSDYSPTGDGLIGALQLLKVMISEKKPLCELASFIQTFPQVLVNSEVRKKVPLESLGKSVRLIEKINTELNSNGRVLVRYSGTENKIRIMVEGEDTAKISCYAGDIAECVISEINGTL